LRDVSSGVGEGRADDFLVDLRLGQRDGELAVWSHDADADDLSVGATDRDRGSRFAMTGKGFSVRRHKQPRGRGGGRCVSYRARLLRWNRREAAAGAASAAARGKRHGAAGRRQPAKYGERRYVTAVSGVRRASASQAGRKHGGRDRAMLINEIQVAARVSVLVKEIPDANDAARFEPDNKIGSIPAVGGDISCAGGKCNNT